MTEAEQLKILKINLLIRTEAFDESLLFFIRSAKLFLKREGIQEPTDTNTEYDQIVISYAAFLYNVRRNQDGKNASALPTFLRYAINSYKYNVALKGGV